MTLRNKASLIFYTYICFIVTTVILIEMIIMCQVHECFTLLTYLTLTTIL